MASTVGTLIKEARTGAGMTQEKLARKIPGLSADDISAAERGLKDLTQDQLKAIAKATGVTQASLINATKAGTSKKSTAKKTTSSKSTATKKTTTKSSSSKASTTTKAKTPANANSTMKVTATERKLIEAYRLADSNAKKSAMSILKGESSSLATSLLGGSSNDIADTLSDLAGGLMENLLGKK